MNTELSNLVKTLRRLETRNVVQRSLQSDKPVFAILGGSDDTQWGIAPSGDGRRRVLPCK